MKLDVVICVSIMQGPNRAEMGNANVHDAARDGDLEEVQRQAEGGWGTWSRVDVNEQDWVSKR